MFYRFLLGLIWFFEFFFISMGFHWGMLPVVFAEIQTEEDFIPFPFSNPVFLYFFYRTGRKSSLRDEILYIFLYFLYYRIFNFAKFHTGLQDRACKYRKQDPVTGFHTVQDAEPRYKFWIVLAFEAFTKRLTLKIMHFYKKSMLRSTDWKYKISSK